MAEELTLKTLTKQRMLQEATEKGKATWFYNLCKKNTKPKKNKNGVEYEDINDKAVKLEFCKKFHPELVKEPKQAKAKEKPLTYLEQVEQAAAKEKAAKKAAKAEKASTKTK